MSKALHIFRSGQHTSMGGQTLAFSAHDLQKTAEAYDPCKHEAPLCVGHPKHDAPAHGWVSSLSASPDGLHATPDQVDTAFAESVAAGRYKKISAAFYPPDHPTNPVPGVYYLRHVGFLGAQPPAIKGLKPVEFADDGDNLVVIEFGDWTDGTVGRALRQMREWLIEKFGLEEADKALPGWHADSLIEASVTPGSEPEPKSDAVRFTEVAAVTVPEPQPETPSMTPEQLKAAEQKLASQQAAFAEQQKALATQQAEMKTAATRRTNAEFAEGLIGEGRLLPAQKNRVVELLTALSDADTELNFAEGDEAITAKPADVLQGLLKTLPKQVEFAEVIKPEEGAAVPARTKVPNGFTVDPARQALHDKALHYAETHNVPFEQAAIAVGA